MDDTVVEAGADTRQVELDADLPFVAAKAAIELDNFIAGTRTETPFLLKLAGILQARCPTSPGPESHGFIDHDTVSILSAALAQTQAQSPTKIKTVEELVVQARDIANRLTCHGSPSTPRADLIWAREFCVALSRAAAAHRRRVHGPRPAHRACR